MHLDWDDEYKTYILDEDRVMRLARRACPYFCELLTLFWRVGACYMQLLYELEDKLEDGGVVLDYHSPELFPERWFDLVLVLRADNSVLYRRLESRSVQHRILWTRRGCRP